MAAPKAKQRDFETVEDRAGPAVPRERASADYERPRENVADKPDPLTLETNKARAGVPVRNMRLVLTVGITLAIAAFIIGYLLAI
jgi:hypothetical protein